MLFTYWIYIGKVSVKFLYTALEKILNFYLWTDFNRIFVNFGVKYAGYVLRFSIKSNNLFME